MQLKLSHLAFASAILAGPAVWAIDTSRPSAPPTALPREAHAADGGAPTVIETPRDDQTETATLVSQHRAVIPEPEGAGLHDSASSVSELASDSRGATAKRADAGDPWRGIQSEVILGDAQSVGPSRAPEQPPDIASGSAPEVDAIRHKSRANLVARGKKYLEMGDVVSARTLFAFAARAGDADAQAGLQMLDGLCPPSAVPVSGCEILSRAAMVPDTPREKRVTVAENSRQSPSRVRTVRAASPRAIITQQPPPPARMADVAH